MPLPFAPTPKDSKLYTDLKNVKVDDLTAAQFDALRGALYAQGVDGSEDEMRRLNLVGEAANITSSSGPIDGSQLIIQTTYTSTGDDADFFKPTEGCWQMIGGDTVSSGGTGSINWSLKDEDGLLALIFATSVNGQEPISDNDRMQTGGPIFVSPECWLYANITTVATSIRPSISFIRVR